MCNNSTLLALPLHCCLQEIKDWHRPRMECIVEEGVDFICIETIAAKVLDQGVSEISLTCQQVVDQLYLSCH